MGLALPTGATREPGTELVPAASSTETPREPRTPLQRPAEPGAQGSSTLYPPALGTFSHQEQPEPLGNLSGD